MAHPSRAAVTAVLGPTNTGKTHLAVERMCAHSSGMMGFPLRLLAREIYDRIVAIKGAHQVALLTGEERIVPPKARWFCCTAESMPISGPPLSEGMSDGFAFVAIDEAQLGIDPERGHIFTDRMLRARGREETMILGSASLTPMVRALVPEAEIISRPRFSTLSYAGAKKLSRLPKRSAIVAFSVQEVYAVAEMLRRHRGGAAVVMGALSPATRNAQVAMFMNGDVDYLVATDAIGMGLNLDVKHVAFASLRKFDGQRSRRLTIAEMAQIAGRAGRHQTDGTFGSLGGEDGDTAFLPEEVLAIEEHRFAPIQRLFWREGAPRMGSIDQLIADLEARPERVELQAAPEASDLAVLRYMADDPAVRARVKAPAHVARLWDACGLPDFQKLGADHHARTVSRIWHYLSEGHGHVPRDWFAQSIARLDNVQGDIDTLSGRIAMVRTWCYIAQRANWLEHPTEMAERTSALESRLSDALHDALRQRFVDRRTAVLLRDVGKGADELPVEIEADGTVQVDGETIGHLHGLRFIVDPRARGSDRKMLLAAAEKRLGKMVMVKAEELIAAADVDIVLAGDAGAMPAIKWQDIEVATLGAGPDMLHPEVRLDKAIVALGQEITKRVTERLNRWIKTQFDKHIVPLVKMTEQAEALETPAPVRAFLVRLVDAGGVLARTELDEALALLDKDQRQIVRRSGITIGVLDIYHHGLLKPGAALWRMALISVKRGKPMLPIPAAGAVLLKLEAQNEQMGARLCGFRGVGDVQLRIDMIERVARGAHEAIARNEAYDVTSPLVVSVGLSDDQFKMLMRNAGFRPVAPRVSGSSALAEVRDSVPPEGVEDAVVPEPSSASVAETPVSEGEAPSDASLSGDDVLSVTAEGALVAAEPIALVQTTGANWVFRGRYKPRADQLRQNSHRRDAGGGAPKNERHNRSKSEGRSGQGNRPDRNAGGGKPQGRFTRAVTAESSKPAGGGAFAGLAALLGREE
jgi:ATP-dependent RNA helicase SUPV3L1/SUV3